MRRLLLTLPTPAENLALDEALLDWAEDGGAAWEFLRLWESSEPLVVVGRSSRVEQEVDTAACDRLGVPVLRRSSGGAAIVAGPGCLMYAVVLSYALRPELRDIRRAHSYVLGRLADSLRPRVPTVACAGTSDLVIADCGLRIADCGLDSNQSKIRKFSGNSLRAKRTHMLYHGTLLYDFDLSLAGRCLKMPPRQPAYRDGRLHDDFLVNLPLAQSELTHAVLDAWPTEGEVDQWPQKEVAQLVAERFSRDEWNHEFR